jgi:hypothetical protein
MLLSPDELKVKVLAVPVVLSLHYSTAQFLIFTKPLYSTSSMPSLDIA